jgi:hypothetical protein
MKISRDIVTGALSWLVLLTLAIALIGFVWTVVDALGDLL